MIDDISDFITRYSHYATSLQELELPSEDMFEAIIHNTGNGAAGTDGIPYSIYRLAPKEISKLLRRFLVQIMLNPHLIRTPNPLLVWIPKAEAGPYSDNWRPLELPTTFLRLLAGGIYYHIAAKVPKVLETSQALLSHFREPQSNYMDAQDFLDKGRKKEQRISFVLVADFVKAFEMVHPGIIIKVLYARKAPLWLITYAKFVLSGRKVTPKINGLVLPALHVMLGVDMGSAMSCLFFCLAVDPLLCILSHHPLIKG